MIWLSIGLSWKITKLRTDPVLVSLPKQVHSIPQNGGFVPTVSSSLIFRPLGLNTWGTRVTHSARLLGCCGGPLTTLKTQLPTLTNTQLFCRYYLEPSERFVRIARKTQLPPWVTRTYFLYTQCNANLLSYEQLTKSPYGRSTFADRLRPSRPQTRVTLKVALRIVTLVADPCAERGLGHVT